MNVNDTKMCTLFTFSNFFIKKNNGIINLLQ